ncbi:MAG: glycosyltransferase family 39 protein [Bacteroidia bacterium]|nr:glycosyltransferase family 39 protein [Bacteroidia bacterium]
MKAVIQYLDQFNTWSTEKMEMILNKLHPVKKTLSLLLFLLSLNWLYYYVGIYNYLEVRPSSIHSSAQCQRASIALNYYEVDMNFFQPRLQKYTDGGGVTGVEFPILYYLDALAYKIFGFNEAIARAISLSIVSLGFFFFFLLARKLLNNSLMALAVVGSAAFSPVLLFYSPNFMPDAPSMALVLVAWFNFFRYREGRKQKYLNYFFMFSALAALIKVVALMSPIVLLCLAVLDKMGFFKKTEPQPLFPKVYPVIIGVGLVVLVVFAWYFYADHLAWIHQNETFSMRPIPGEPGTFKQLLEYLQGVWLFQYYSYESYVLMISSLVVMIIFHKFVSRLLFSITLFLFLGNVCFVYLFLNQFIHHDYYIISILPLIFFLFLTLADTINTLANRYFVALRFIFLVIVFFNMKEAVLNCRLNYEYRYSNKIYYTTYDHRPYFDLEKRLREAGIKRDDITISGFDDTFCSTLYLMNQVGWPIHSWESVSEIKDMLGHPKSKYLILNDTARFNQLLPNDLDKHILFSHRGLIVYKLKDK